MKRHSVTLASFPTHEPHKRKKIGWAWIKRENRPRRVAIAEICSGDKIAYALEIEPTNQEHAILVLARNDFQRIGAGFDQSLLFSFAKKIWSPERANEQGVSRKECGLINFLVGRTSIAATLRCIFG